MPRARSEPTEFLTSFGPTLYITSNSSSVVIFHPFTSISQRPITLQRYTRKYQARTNNVHPHGCPHLMRESSGLVLFFFRFLGLQLRLCGMMHPSIPPHVSALPTNSWPASASRADLFSSAKKVARMYEVGVPRLLVCIRALSETVLGSLYSFSFTMLMLVLCSALARPIKRWRRRRSGRVLEEDSRCSSSRFSVTFSCVVPSRSVGLFLRYTTLMERPCSKACTSGTWDPCKAQR